ncbi:MAG: beta-galactosidase trimerization domain-containing protein, partial [bacterium]|nr:beta-galactosidase trimerization domain-containing protein [bacterium]
GAKGIYEALKQEKGFETTFVKVMPSSVEELLKYDVLVIGSLRGLEQGPVDLLRAYVNCGGGILLNHDACGYRGWKEPLFPEVCRGLRTTNTTVMVPLPVTKHALLQAMPAEYSHAYYDHVVLGRGPKGTVIVEDSDGTPAVIVGEIGHGRVVANGAITGYWSKLDIQEQGEGSPQGGELKLLLNAVLWLGERGITRIDQAELGRRTAAFKVAAPSSLPENTASSDWFSDDMLRSRLLVRQPINELKGKFFMFVDWITVHWTDSNQLRIWIRQLKWMGVTDVIYADLTSGNVIHHMSDIPRKYPGMVSVNPGTEDLLLNLVNAAADAGINVWTLVHPGKAPEGMAALDKDGKKYVYSSYGSISDVLSPAFRSMYHSLLDEYAEKYNKHGNFKGIYYDEPFFNYVDFHGDDLELFDRFCRSNFGEALPADMSDRLAQKVAWVDPSDKWWRRYILFKNSVNTGFVKELIDYSRSKGLQTIVELRPTAALGSGWSFGMDNDALTRLGAAYYFVASGDYCEPCFIYPNALIGGHVGRTWGYYNTVSLRGHKASIHFVDNQFWRFLIYGSNPKGGLPLQYLIHNTREWADAANLAKVSILHNQNTLQMLLGKDAPKEAVREVMLLERLSYAMDADAMLVGAREYYGNYPVLVAPAYALRGISPETFTAIESYVKAGGTLVMLGGCSVSLPDLTKEQDKTSELAGIRYVDKNIAVSAFTYNDKEVKLSNKASVRQVEVISSATKTLAVFSGTTAPAITLSDYGRGRVISLQLDLAVQLGQDNREVERVFTSLVSTYADPPVSVQGDLRVMTTLKKGNWVAVTLYGSAFPCKGTVSVDMKKLGVSKKGYRVMMLSKGMELSLPGDFWGKKGVWTAEDVKAGIPVTIVTDNNEKLALPEKFDLSAFSEKDASYVDINTRKGWTSGVHKRHYEHEILVIAPDDELTVNGK